MRYHQLTEMPIRINNTNLAHPDEEISSHYVDDRKIMHSSKATAKIIARWDKSLVDVDLYLYDARLTPEHALDKALDYEIGMILDPDYTDDFKDVRSIISDPNPNAISVILTNNDGAQRKPLTAWMIAHRLYHAIQSPITGSDHRASSIMIRLNDQLEGVGFDLQNYRYNMPKVELAELMGSSRACRDGKLTNYYELLPECFAQYILTGKIVLRPLPEHLYSGDREYSLDWCNDQVKAFERYLNSTMGELVNAVRGKVLIL